MNELTRLKRATRARAKARAEWHAAIREAHAQGATLRAIATAAGVSHVRVLQIVRPDDETEEAP